MLRALCTTIPEHRTKALIFIAESFPVKHSGDIACHLSVILNETKYGLAKTLMLSG